MRYSLGEIKSGIGLLVSNTIGCHKTYIGIARNKQFCTWGEYDQANNKMPKTVRLVAVAYPTKDRSNHFIIWDAGFYNQQGEAK